MPSTINNHNGRENGTGEIGYPIIMTGLTGSSSSSCIPIGSSRWSSSGTFRPASGKGGTRALVNLPPSHKNCGSTGNKCEILRIERDNLDSLTCLERG